VQLAGRGEELKIDLVNVKQAQTAFDELMRSTNSLLVPRSRARSDLEATLRDLATTASNLRGFSQTVDRDPSAILSGRASP
jgi:paraquat-inducible protein B